MSLETELAANTAAIKELISVWGVLNAQAKNITARVETGEVTKVTAAKQVEIPVSPKPAATPDAPAPEVNTAQTAPATIATASPSEVKVELKDLSAAVTAAATRNRDGLVALLAKHNVKRASELPADAWAALVVELEAL